MYRLQTARAALLRAVKTFSSPSPLQPLSAAEVPLRAELFSADQMERHGTTLAQWHSLGTAPARDQLLLRLALIENLRRISARVVHSLHERNRASGWAEQMLQAAEHDPKSLILVISDMARASPTLVNTFVAELARRLQGHSAALALPLTWIAQRLSEQELTIEQMVQSETQSQASNQVCVSSGL